MRGKSKSPDQKFKEKKAKVDAFLLDSWLKQLKEDPTLAARIAEQKYGMETTMAYGDHESEYGGEPDLLSVLRQAREAKELLADELGSGKGSWMKDFAELIKALPSAFQALGQVNPQALQQFTQHPAQIAQPPTQALPDKLVQAQQADQAKAEVRLDSLIPLVELEPEQAWQKLQAEGESGWLNYLSRTSYEDIETTLKGLADANPDAQPQIEAFIKQKRRWLEQLVQIAHQS